MPFDPSIPFKVDLPEPHRPLERYLTLRDMMDQRRVRESQMRRLEMQEQEGLEEQQEIQGIRELFRTNPRPTPADIYRVAPTKGGPIVKGMFDQLTQERAAAKAAEELTEAKAKNKKNQEIILGNRQFALLEEPDDTKRNAAWGELSKELVELGYTTPEEAAAPPPDLPTLSRMAHQFYVATQGPEKAQERLTKAQTEADRRAKERLDRSKQQIELAGYYAGTVKDQGSLDRWLAIAPEEIAAGVDRVYSPEWLQKTQPALLTAQQRVQQAEQARLDSPDKVIEYMNQPGRTPEELVRAKASLEQMVQYRMDTRPQFVQPGVDVPFSPDVEAQKTRISQAAATDKPLSAEGAKVKAIAETMIPEARQLQTAIRKGGRAAIAGILTGSDVKLSRLAEQVSDKIGRMRSGGAVNKQEEQRFMAQISRIADLFAGPDAAVEAIESYINEANQVVGGMTRGGQAPGNQPQGQPPPVVRWGKDAQGNPVRLP